MLMKPDPSELWKRLITDVEPTREQPDDRTVNRIVAQLRWQPPGETAPNEWASLWWSLTSKFVIPAAAALLIISACLPLPAQTPSVDQVDDLIATALQQP